MPHSNVQSAQYDLEEMFARARSGSSEAILAFFEKYADPILMAVRARMNRDLCSVWDSADFMQRTRLKLHNFRPQEQHFESPQAFLTYMVTIATREMQQEKRKRGPQKHGGGTIDKSMEALTQAEQHQLIDHAPLPDVAEETEEAWRDALAQLLPVHRHVAERLREGYSHDEIVAEIGISLSTVGRVVSRLRELLVSDVQK